jgi:hypothetical protein
MAKDPAFLFYTGDFLVGTMTMSNEQVGKYIRLLCMEHQKGGYLTEKDILQVIGSLDPEVMMKFNMTEDGLYYNERLLQETQKRIKYSESRRNNRLKQKADNHMINICKDDESYDEHMENTNIYSSSLSLDLSLTKEKKKPYGEFKNVLLTDAEYAKVQERKLSEHIERLSLYKASTGRKYKSDYATILSWARKDGALKEPKNESKKKFGTDI